MSEKLSSASGMVPPKHLAKALTLCVSLGVFYGLYSANQYFSAKEHRLTEAFARAGVQDKNDIKFIKRAASDNSCGLLATNLVPVCSNLRATRMLPTYREF